MILHLSDLHFGTEKQECIEAIRKFCEKNSPEAIVVSGDLTQRAGLKQFKDCKAFLESLNAPYLVVPGNHDIPLYNIWSRFLNPFKKFQSYFGSLNPVLETEHFYILGLNSIRPRYHTKGYISLDQIQDVDAQLANVSSDKVKLIAVHQPFYAPEDDESVNDCPVLGVLALKRWGQRGLYGLLHGHLHQSAVYDLNLIYELGLIQPLLDIHAGTATSYRLHDGLPNSFNVIQQDGDVQPYFFDEKQKLFISLRPN